MTEKSWESEDKEDTLQVVAFMNSMGLNDDPASPSFRAEVIIKKLLRLGEGIEYDIREAFSVEDGEYPLLEVLAYLKDIYYIKELGWDTTIDFYDPEEDSHVKKIINLNAPSFKIDIVKNTLLIKKSPFYRSLDEADKVLFYLQSHKEISNDYHNVELPKRFRTDEFYNNADKYFSMLSKSHFSLKLRGHKRQLEILRMTSRLAFGHKFLEEGQGS
jgi:hypothetical protein